MSPIMKKTKFDSKIAAIASGCGMKAMFKDIDKRHIHQLFPGSDNQDDILLGLAENLKLPSGLTTISAAILVHPMLSLFYHSFGVTAKLIEFLTAKTDDGSGNEKTHAIKMVLPTLLNVLTAEHGMDASTPTQTNSDKITIDMSKAAGDQEVEVAIGNCCGKMFNDLKNLGDKKTEMYVLPTATELGAKPGNENKSKKPLSYSGAYFNNADGSLKLTPIKLRVSKSVVKADVTNKSISDVVLVYGYIIPIEGTENGINIKSPTASTNDSEFVDMFGG